MLSACTNPLCLAALSIGVGCLETFARAIFLLSIHKLAAACALPIYIQSVQMLKELRENDVLAVPSDTGRRRHLTLGGRV